MGKWLQPGKFSGAKSPMGFFDVVPSLLRGPSFGIWILHGT